MLFRIRALARHHVARGQFRASRPKALVLAAALALGTAPALSHAAAPAGGLYDMLVGSYTGPQGGDGIHVYRFDPATGAATPLSSVQTVNPSYLLASRDGRLVYAVNELPGDDGPASVHGGISAFRFDAKSGALTLLNRVPLNGNDPCYLSFSPDGKYLVVANYSVAPDPGGSFEVFALDADGKIGARVHQVGHSGSGPVRGRQDGAHVHSAVFAPDGQYLFAQDLGDDKVYGYRYTPDAPSAADGSRAVFAPAQTPHTKLRAGQGPRHLVFGPDGRFAYLVSELDGSISVYAYQAGRLTWIETLPLAAPEFKGALGGGALHLSPDGRFLYVSNRGDANEIAYYSVDAKTGRLTYAGRQSTLGKTPREFAIDPSGKWLIAGNQGSDSVVIFKRDPATGHLEPQASPLALGKPADVKLVPVPAE